MRRGERSVVIRAGESRRKRSPWGVTRGRHAGDDGADLMDEAFVTILFTHLVGSTSMFGRQGDEAANVLRRRHFDALRRAIADHDGREVKSTGDGLMVVFASAVAAVRCAVDMQQATTRRSGARSPGGGRRAAPPTAWRCAGAWTPASRCATARTSTALPSTS